MLLILVVIILSSSVFSQENNPSHFRYQILSSDKTTSTVTEMSFNFIPHLIHALFVNELLETGKTVVVNTDWEKAFISAWANQETSNHFSLNFWGGMARIPGMTDDAHALVACHEMGHVLGNGPRHTLKDFLWASSEGQSDYFATGLCLKKYFEFKNKQTSLSPLVDIPESANTLCRITYNESLNYLICLHSVRATMAFRSVLAHSNQGHTLPEFDTPSTEKVIQTIQNAYPSIQCRIDTLYQGILCPIKNYPCRGTGLGTRPQCWFNGK